MSTPATVVGNLTKNRYFQEATSRKAAFIRFTIASSERYRDSDGEFQDGETSYISAVAFGRVAENFNETFPEGESNRVIAVGKLETSARNVVLLSKDNVAEIQDARKDDEKIVASELEFDKDDRLSLVTETSLIVEAVGPDLRYATAEVEKNPKEGESGGKAKSKRRTRKSEDADEEEEAPAKRTRRTRKSKDADEGAEAEESADETSDAPAEEGEAEEKPARTRRTRRTRTTKEEDF